MLKKSLTEQELLSKVDDKNIFYHYFGNFDFNKCYPSVFRKDTHPSTGFYTSKEGELIYNDLTTNEKWGAVNFVAKLFGLSFHQAIEKIAKDFGIIEGKDNSERVKIKKFKNKEKRPNNYEVTKGIWKEKDLLYWKDYSISQEELVDNFVFPCRELKVNKYIIENPKEYDRYIYFINHFDKNVYFKVYTPYDPIYKWVGSVPKDALFGLQELPFASKRLMISKGQKDRIIWKKYFTDVIAPQTEAPNSIPEDICQMLCDNYDEIYVSYDADEPGIKGSQFYEEKYEWKPFRVPEVYYKKDGIKDFADLVKEKGLQTFEKYLNWSKLI